MNRVQIRGRVKSCDFCDEIRGGPSYFGDMYDGILWSRKIYESANFVVMPSIGQITWGHLLVISKQHFTASSTLPGDLFDEFRELVEKIKRANRCHLGDATIAFEHGTILKVSAGGCGITHLHVHLLPCAIELDVLPHASQHLKFKKIPSFRSLTEFVGQNASYVYLSQPGAGEFVGLTTNLPSQYMRQAVAQTLGKSEWDWRKFGVEEELISTYQFYRKVLGNIGVRELSEPVGAVVEA